MHQAPLLALALLTGSAASLALRHDVEEEQYVGFGQSFPAVVQVGGLASGTLIAPDWVLTVAHAPEMIGKMMPGQPLKVRVGETSYEVARVVVPEARKDDPEGPDIALLQLAESVPGEIAPLVPWTEAVEPGTRFVLAGWGILATGDEGVVLSPEAMASPTRLLRAGWNVCERVDEEAQLFIARFDGPDKGVELEAGPCLGDSGGPALLRVEGTDGKPASWRVAGVIAAIDDGDEDRIVGEYGEEFLLTSVAAHADWIRATIEP